MDVAAGINRGRFGNERTRNCIRQRYGNQCVHRHHGVLGALLGHRRFFVYFTAIFALCLLAVGKQFTLRKRVAILVGAAAMLTFVLNSALSKSVMYLDAFSLAAKLVVLAVIGGLWFCAIRYRFEADLWMAVAVAFAITYGSASVAMPDLFVVLDNNAMLLSLVLVLAFPATLAYALIRIATDEQESADDPTGLLSKIKSTSGHLLSDSITVLANLKEAEHVIRTIKPIPSAHSCWQPLC